jgi:hypothetical protein
MRWLKTVLEKQSAVKAKAVTGAGAAAAKPFFAYIGPHARKSLAY